MTTLAHLSNRGQETSTLLQRKLVKLAWKDAGSLPVEHAISAIVAIGVVPVGRVLEGDVKTCFPNPSKTISKNTFGCPARFFECPTWRTISWISGMLHKHDEWGFSIDTRTSCFASHIANLMVFWMILLDKMMAGCFKKTGNPQGWLFDLQWEIPYMGNKTKRMYVWALYWITLG